MEAVQRRCETRAPDRKSGIKIMPSLPQTEMIRFSQLSTTKEEIQLVSNGAISPEKWCIHARKVVHSGSGVVSSGNCEFSIYFHCKQEIF